MFVISKTQAYGSFFSAHILRYLTSNRQKGFCRGFRFYPLTPMSDQDRISSYSINTISTRKVMRIKKILISGLLVDPIPNSPD